MVECGRKVQRRIRCGAVMSRNAELVCTILWDPTLVDDVATGGCPSPASRGGLDPTLVDDVNTGILSAQARMRRGLRSKTIAQVLRRGADNSRNLPVDPSLPGDHSGCSVKSRRPCA